jgi:hypothetical protein
MARINGKVFGVAESSFGDDSFFGDEEYKKQCCEQCNRLWAAHKGRRTKSVKHHPYCGACMGYLLEDVLRVLTALDAPCRYCGDVPWIDYHNERHVTISCENEECAYYMSTDADGEKLSEAQAIERWNYLNTGKQKKPRIKAV